MDQTKNITTDNSTAVTAAALPVATANTTAALTSKANSTATSKTPLKNTWLHFVAGGTGACIGAIVTCPLDVIKTRLQSSLYKPAVAAERQSILRKIVGPLSDTGSILRSVYRTEGFTALYKGLDASLVGVVPARAINFFVYGNTKRALTKWNGGVEGPLVHLSAAAAAGVVTATATNPIWMIKTRLQLQSKLSKETNVRYSNSLDCLRQILKQEGVAGLYKGVTASYLGITEGAMQWVMYEELKKNLEARRLKIEEEDGTIEYKNGIRKKNTFDMIDNFFAAGGAKLVAAAVTYPHEVIRTRLRQAPMTSDGRSKYNGIVQSFNLIVKEEGPRALYGGLTAHLLRAVPNSAVMFFCYEVILHWFGNED